MQLKPLTEHDLDLILPWRNAPAVRRAMYSHHEISPEEHRAWFERMRDDPSARWYLYHDAAGVPQGVVYFTALDPVQKTAFWGFYAKPEAERGTGLRMEYAALDLAFRELGLRKLNCEVLASNVVVLNLHKKVGFNVEGQFREQHLYEAECIDVIRLSLLAREWNELRDWLRMRIEKIAFVAIPGDPPPLLNE